MGRVRRLCGKSLGIVLLGGLIQAAPAQQPSTPAFPLVFDVVSIKPDVSGPGAGSPIFVGCHGTDGTDPPWKTVPMGMCVGSRASAEMLLSYAYDVGFSLNAALKGTFVGEPDWFTRDRFAINTKSETPPSLHEQRAMLQAVLADRFKLRCHIEMTEVDGLALMVGKNGAKLQPVSPEGTTSTPNTPGIPRSSFFQMASGQENNSGIGFRIALRAGSPGVTGLSLNFVNVPMDYVAKELTNQLGSPVVNKTGLKGSYNLATSKFSSRDDLDPQNPSLSTALEELGLRLEKQKVSMPVLVIEHIEKPALE